MQFVGINVESHWKKVTPNRKPETRTHRKGVLTRMLGSLRKSQNFLSSKPPTPRSVQPAVSAATKLLLIVVDACYIYYVLYYYDDDMMMI